MPRLFLKADADSSIGRGAAMGPKHFRPHIARILEVALATSRDEKVMVTEGWRPPRHRRDKHTTWEAFDFRASHLNPDDAADWSNNISDKLGNDYDVVAHGTGANFHIHVEYDPD